MTPADERRNLAIVYVNIALYALCYQLQRPVEPFLVEQLGASPAGLARLQSFFAFVQTVGSPLVGRMLDVIGARAGFVVVFAASALSYALLATATTLPLLYLSKLPTLLQHAFLCAQAVLTTACADGAAARAAALGRLTAAYTVGATIGPALGGHLARAGDLYAGARLAVVGSLLSAAFATGLV